MSAFSDETTVLKFNRPKFTRDFTHIRKFVKKVTQEEAAKQIGIARNSIAQIEAFVRPNPRHIILMAFWADMDLRDYVEVKLLEKDQPQLALGALPGTTLPDPSE